jgi:hypothetical protein
VTNATSSTLKVRSGNDFSNIEIAIFTISETDRSELGIIAVLGTERALPRVPDLGCAMYEKVRSDKVACALYGFT